MVCKELAKGEDPGWWVHSESWKGKEAGPERQGAETRGGCREHRIHSFCRY